MDGHTAIIVTDSVSRGTVSAIFVTFMIKISFSETTNRLPAIFVPCGINVKSMFIYYSLIVYNFLHFSSILNYYQLVHEWNT